MAGPRTPYLRTTFALAVLSSRQPLTLDGRLNIDEDLDLDPLRLDFRSGDPELPLTADPSLSQCERDSVTLTIKDHSDSPRQGRSVLRWLDEWKRKWENICKLVKYAHTRRTFRDDLVPC